MKWGTRILTISLLITLVLVSGCILDFGKNKLDFGNSDAAQKALACFCQTYGDPATYNGPPRLIAPLVSTELKDNIPQDKVSRFSTETKSIFFWVIYQNFQQGEDLHLSWIFQNKVVTTITKKTDTKTGVAFGEFVRPDAGWPEGIHTIKIEGEGNKTEVTFYIENGPTERTVFDFTSPDGVKCQDLITVVDHWILVDTPDWVLQCSPSPNNSIPFMGSTGTAVTPGTPVQLILINEPDSGTQGAQDLPQEGILISSTITRSNGTWEYTWNGIVPGYTLKNGQIYKVNIMLPDGTKTTLKFRYMCTGTGGDNSIIGYAPNPVVISCYPPDNATRFTGSTGSAVPPGTPVQLKLFDLPDAANQEILIGSTNTKNDGTWEYTWNGTLPGYTLKPGQEYMVNFTLPGGRYSITSFNYQCSDPEGKWQIYGGTSNSVLSCSPPNNTIKFMGYTGPSVTHGTDIQLKLFNLPNAGTQEILIGSTNTKNDGTWEYTWNGNVAGYTFKDGQEYGVKAMLPWRYTKMSFIYKCPA